MTVSAQFGCFTIVSKPENGVLQKLFLVIVMHENYTLCNKCRHKYFASGKKKTDCYPTPKLRRSSAVFSSPPSVSLSIPSTSRSQSNCFLCKRPGSKLIVAPASARSQVFLKCEIIIPADGRCCLNHVDDGYFKSDV